MPLFNYHGKEMKQPVGLAEMSPVFTLILIVVVRILLRQLHVLSTGDATSISPIDSNWQACLTSVNAMEKATGDDVLSNVPGTVQKASDAQVVGN